LTAGAGWWETMAHRWPGRRRQEGFKNFLPLRVTEPWHRLPREAVESPSLEIFQTRLDAVCLLWVTLLRQGGWAG